MSKSAYARLFCRSRLKEGWDEFWKSASRHTAPGVDSLTPSDFLKNLDRNLDNTLRQLHGGYVFSPLRPFLVPKTNGKECIICVPTVSDRLVQRLIVSYLMSRPAAARLFNDASFGFLKKRGVAAARDRAIALRACYPWAYKSDISSFFDNVDRILLMNEFRRLFRETSLFTIVSDAARSEIKEESEAIKRIIRSNGIRNGHGIRQGMPISPFFSNIVLENFDRKMLERGYKIVRYADDFIVFSSNKKECEQIDEYARQLLTPLKLSLPSLVEGGKTAIYEPKAPAEFLGMELEWQADNAYALKITDAQKRKIRERLSLFRDVDHLFKNRISLHQIYFRVKSAIGGYRAAYSSAINVSDLEPIFSSAMDHTVRKIYEDAFGREAIGKVKPHLRPILGLEEFPPRR